MGIQGMNNKRCCSSTVSATQGALSRGVTPAEEGGWDTKRGLRGRIGVLGGN